MMWPLLDEEEEKREGENCSMPWESFWGWSYLRKLRQAEGWKGKERESMLQSERRKKAEERGQNGLEEFANSRQGRVAKVAGYASKKSLRVFKKVLN